MQNTIYLNKLLQRTKLNSQNLSDVKSFIYVRSKWLDNEVDFTFLLSTNNLCYKSRLTSDEFKAIAAELDMNYQEFHQDCKKALTANISLPGFDYEIDAENLEFRLIRCEGFETVYLELSLREITHSSVCDMLDTAIDLLDEQQKTKTDNACDEKTLQEYQAYVVESKKLERTMLKKFILLLNSKKEKIRELEAKIKRRNSHNDTDEEMAQDTEPDETFNNEENANNATKETVYTDETQALTPPR